MSNCSSFSGRRLISAPALRVEELDDPIANLVANPRTCSSGLALGILQRPVVAPQTGNDRTLIAAPHRDQHLSPLRQLVVSFAVGAPKSMPTSLIAVTTSGWTRGLVVPAEIARAFVGSDNRLNHAAAICDRPALWTHAKSTVFMLRHLGVRNDDALGRSWERRHEPAEQDRRRRGAGELRGDESRHVSRTDAGERVRRARATVTAGFANDVDAVNQ